MRNIPEGHSNLYVKKNLTTPCLIQEKKTRTAK